MQPDKPEPLDKNVIANGVFLILAAVIGALLQSLGQIVSGFITANLIYRKIFICLFATLCLTIGSYVPYPSSILKFRVRLLMIFFVSCLTSFYLDPLREFQTPANTTAANATPANTASATPVNTTFEWVIGDWDESGYKIVSPESRDLGVRPYIVYRVHYNKEKQLVGWCDISGLTVQFKDFKGDSKSVKARVEADNGLHGDCRFLPLSGDNAKIEFTWVKSGETNELHEANIDKRVFQNIAKPVLGQFPSEKQSDFIGRWIGDDKVIWHTFKDETGQLFLTSESCEEQQSEKLIVVELVSEEKIDNTTVRMKGKRHEKTLVNGASSSTSELGTGTLEAKNNKLELKMVWAKKGQWSKTLQPSER